MQETTFKKLYKRIDEMLQKDRVILAIDGGSASGKTTLGEILKERFDATVFHMDDFFLRPEQRTKERFQEPGGNVDRERFLEEVLLPLSQGKDVTYRRFDCATFTLQEPITEEVKQLVVVEGAYSMHPDLADRYDLKVFLEINPTLQKERVMKRSPEKADRFFNEWIPMEEKYFQAMEVKERADMVIEIR